LDGWDCKFFKVRYIKLRVFEFWMKDCKNDENSERLNKIFLNNFFGRPQQIKVHGS
jgi:hypothetical protein